MEAEGIGLHTCLQLSSLFLCSLIFYDSGKDSLCNAKLSLSQCVMLMNEKLRPALRFPFS